MSEILALGDCNTLGTKYLVDNAYPERFAKALNKTVDNCGFTMATSNEMLHFFQDFKEKKTEIILIQYGLVDSWKTFKYAPYVLYYPDNTIRKIFRKVVKKYKKTAKKIGLNRLLGVSNVVEIESYQSHIESVIQRSQNCRNFLISTIPNLDTTRNIEIIRYNEVLSQLSAKYTHVYYVDVYNDFADHPEYYLDNTHMNEDGYDFIAKKLRSVYNQFEQNKENIS